MSESLDKDSFVINGNLELFEKRFTALEKRVAAAGRNGLTEDARRALATEYVRYFQGDGGELLQMYVALYRGAMKTVEDKTPFGSRWLDEGVNPAARTLSRLGPRVGRLESVLGLDAPTTPPPAPGRNIPAEVLGLSFASAAGAVPGLRDDEPQDDVHPAALYKPVISASMAKVRPVPAPSEPVQGQEKRFSEFSLMEGVMAGPGWSEELSDRVRAGVNHLFGLTRTVGDPDGRAGLVHHQTGGTCMVVSQQQVLVQAGLLPPGDATAIERALAKQANDRGDAVRNGVAWRDSGKLLVERGVPVVSHARASDERLLAAAASGRMLIAGVDAGKFWRDPRHDGGGHAIVVTGAEVDKNGKVVGLFVNDSGTGDARRYVTTELFLAAFDKDGRYFLEIL